MQPEMAVFVRGEMHQHIKYGFRILLPAADAVRVFGVKLNMSRIDAVPQKHRRLRIILNLLENPIRVSLVSTTLQTGRLPWFQCNFDVPCLTPYRKSGRRTDPMVQSWCQILT